MQQSKQLTALACLVLLCARTAGADEIRAFVSTGIASAYRPIVAAFERESGHTVVTTFGSGVPGGPNSLLKRIADGEPADLVIIGAAQVDDLAKAGTLVAGSRTDLLVSGLGVMVRAGAQRPDVRTLDAFRAMLLKAKTIGVSNAGSGQYVTRDLLPRLGLADRLAPKLRAVPSGPVAVLVANGTAEIGLQGIAEVLGAEGVDYVGPFPPGAQQESVTTAGVMFRASHPAAAAALIRFLQGPLAMAEIRKAGMSPYAESVASRAR